MTQEQARQEAERRINSTIGLGFDISVQINLISINREIDLCIFFYNISISYIMRMHIQDKLQDLNQIKDELLKM